MFFTTNIIKDHMCTNRENHACPNISTSTYTYLTLKPPLLPAPSLSHKNARTQQHKKTQHKKKQEDTTTNTSTVSSPDCVSRTNVTCMEATFKPKKLAMMLGRGCVVCVCGCQCVCVCLCLPSEKRNLTRTTDKTCSILIVTANPNFFTHVRFFSHTCMCWCVYV